MCKGVMESLKYPWKMHINYNTAEEYQTQLSSITHINEEGEHVSMMDNLYEHTKNNKKIMELCKMASEKMLLSDDEEYGQVMLFSYDCFSHFHILLQWHFGNVLGETLEEGMEQKVMESMEWLRNYFMESKPTSITK